MIFTYFEKLKPELRQKILKVQTAPDSFSEYVTFLKNIENALAAARLDIPFRSTYGLISGHNVWLLRRHVGSTRPSSKLDVRRLGPFPVIGRIGTLAYRLELPSSIKIHPVFHVSLLEPHNPNTFPGRVVAPPGRRACRLQCHNHNLKSSLSQIQKT